MFGIKICILTRLPAITYSSLRNLWPIRFLPFQLQNKIKIFGASAWKLCLWEKISKPACPNPDSVFYFSEKKGLGPLEESDIRMTVLCRTRELMTPTTKGTVSNVSPGKAEQSSFCLWASHPYGVQALPKELRDRGSIFCGSKEQEKQIAFTGYLVSKASLTCLESLP